MAQFNPVNISGNFLSGLGEGLQAGQQIRQIQDRNKLAEIGPGIISGDPDAMNALAAIDPFKAEQIQRQRAADTRDEQRFQQQTQLTDARLAQIEAESARAAAAEARRLTEEQRAAEIAQIDGVLAAASAAYDQGPEAYRQWVETNAADIQESNLDPAEFAYENFPIFARGLIGAKKGLSESFEFAGDLTGGGDASAAEEKVRRLISAGYDRDTAIKIADGAYSVSRNPYTDEVEVIDKGTGLPVAGATTQQTQPPPAAFAATTKQPREELSFGDNIPTGGENAFGIRGTLGAAANAVTDAAGFGQIFPNLAEQRNFFRSFEEQALVSLAQAYPRQPAAALMERLRALAPNIGNIMEGPGQAIGELKTMRRNVMRDLEAAQNSLNRPGRMRPEDRDALRSEASGLESMVSAIDEALTRLGDAPSGGGQNTTSSGISWSIEE